MLVVLLVGPYCCQCLTRGSCWTIPRFCVSSRRASFCLFTGSLRGLSITYLAHLLRHYGFPSKMITIIVKFYKHFATVESGVPQDCTPWPSPVLFLVTIDWITRNMASDKPRGVQWNLLACLICTPGHPREDSVMQFVWLFFQPHFSPSDLFYVNKGLTDSCVVSILYNIFEQREDGSSMLFPAW